MYFYSWVSRCAGPLHSSKFKTQNIKVSVSLTDLNWRHLRFLLQHEQEFVPFIVCFVFISDGQLLDRFVRQFVRLFVRSLNRSFILTFARLFVVFFANLLLP